MTPPILRLVSPDQPLELPELKGCRTVTLVAMVTHQPESNGPVQLLTESLDAAGDCPLDITADLMVRPI